MNLLDKWKYIYGDMLGIQWQSEWNKNSDRCVSRAKLIWKIEIEPAFTLNKLLFQMFKLQ